MAKKKKKLTPLDTPVSDPFKNEEEITGLETAGQSGDIQGLSTLPQADSESVAELVAEGQSFEAAVISGVEDAPDADEAPVKTKQAPEDDVPLEYQKQDRPD
jgi:hypothetical protein